jgi:hypothetical protein
LFIVFGICEFGLIRTPHQRNRSVGKTAGQTFLFLCLVMGFAESGNARSVPSAQVTSSFAIADFDGDSRPDLATVRVAQSSSVSTRYWIDLQLSSGPRHALGIITAPTGGLQISSRDVNGDNFLDVIVTTSWTNRPVAVLLNDGHGNFTRSDSSAVPSAVWSSEDSWTCAIVEIKDSAAALLSRCLSGDCEGAAALALPQSVVGLLVASASQNPHFFSASSFLVRAPPSFVFHV